jgi:hypothetical protein
MFSHHHRNRRTCNRLAYCGPSVGAKAELHCASQEYVCVISGLEEQLVMRSRRLDHPFLISGPLCWWLPNAGVLALTPAAIELFLLHRNSDTNGAHWKKYTLNWEFEPTGHAKTWLDRGSSWVRNLVMMQRCSSIPDTDLKLLVEDGRGRFQRLR